MTQENDYSITMSQENYISRINPIHIQPTRKANVDLAVTERETGPQSFDWIIAIRLSKHKT